MHEPRTSRHDVGGCRFGVFEFDVRALELRKSGRRVAIRPQPLKVLARLLSRPGELVGREDLERDLWGGDTFVDFEQGVNHAIRDLRAALGDVAESPRFIQTLPRRGYRFIAPVELIAVEGAPSTPGVGTAGPAVVNSILAPDASRPMLLAAGALALGLALVVVGWQWPRSSLILEGEIARDGDEVTVLARLVRTDSRAGRRPVQC